MPTTQYIETQTSSSPGRDQTATINLYNANPTTLRIIYDGLEITKMKKQTLIEVILNNQNGWSRTLPDVVETSRFAEVGFGRDHYCIYEGRYAKIAKDIVDRVCGLDPNLYDKYNPRYALNDRHEITNTQLNMEPENQVRLLGFYKNLSRHYFDSHTIRTLICYILKYNYTYMGNLTMRDSVKCKVIEENLRIALEVANKPLSTSIKSRMNFDGLNCSICLEPLKTFADGGMDIVVSHCGHDYCTACYLHIVDEAELADKPAYCAVCRDPIS